MGDVASGTKKVVPQGGCVSYFGGGDSFRLRWMQLRSFQIAQMSSRISATRGAVLVRRLRKTCPCCGEGWQPDLRPSTSSPPPTAVSPLSRFPLSPFTACPSIVSPPQQSPSNYAGVNFFDRVLPLMRSARWAILSWLSSRISVINSGLFSFMRSARPLTPSWLSSFIRQQIGWLLPWAAYGILGKCLGSVVGACYLYDVFSVLLWVQIITAAIYYRCWRSFPTGANYYQRGHCILGPYTTVILAGSNCNRIAEPGDSGIAS